MPIVRCTSSGKAGWKYGSKGKCYIGPGAKTKAALQGRAIKASQARSAAKGKKKKGKGK